MWHRVFIEDNEYVHALYQKNFAVVRLFVLNNNGKSEQAEDIYHDAFLAVWRNIQLEKFHPENEAAFNAYLVKTAKNKWIDYLRSNNYKMTTELHPDFQIQVKEEEEEIVSREMIIKVKRHFLEMGDNCRDLLTMFYYKKASMKDIAKHFNWSEPTARNNKYRCLQKLRKLINEKS